MSNFVVKNGLQIGGGSSLKSGTIAGNATLDLTSGNFFSHTPTADTIFVFSNPPASGKAHGFALKVTGAEVGEGYDLANASYDSVSFDVSAQETLPIGLFFKSDGTSMYVIGESSDAVNQYNLSTAWDITSATFTQSFSVATQETGPTDISFSPDGTKMFFNGYVNDSVYEYTLSTAWDVSTASYVQNFSVATEETAPYGVTFKPDGSKMYIVGTSSDAVHQYSLSTAFDLSSASYDSVSFNILTQEAGASGITFKPDGTKMFVVGFSGDEVNEYSLSTAWDISTSSYVQTFSVAAQDTFPHGVVFKDDGSKMYVIGNGNDNVYQYSTSGTPAAATFTYPASVAWPNGVPPTAPAVGETDVLTFYTEDGGTTYNGFQAGDAMQ